MAIQQDTMQSAPPPMTPVWSVQLDHSDVLSAVAASALDIANALENIAAKRGFSNLGRIPHLSGVPGDLAAKADAECRSVLTQLHSLMTGPLGSPPVMTAAAEQIRVLVAKLAYTPGLSFDPEEFPTQTL